MQNYRQDEHATGVAEFLNEEADGHQDDKEIEEGDGEAQQNFGEALVFEGKEAVDVEEDAHEDDHQGNCAGVEFNIHLEDVFVEHNVGRQDCGENQQGDVAEEQYELARHWEPSLHLYAPLFL